MKKQHPELQEGEVFLTNCFPPRGGGAKIGWKTKRFGTVAYDIAGKPVPGGYPCFVQKEELITAGIDISKL